MIGLSAFAGGVFIINQILFFITSFAVKKEYEWNALYKMGTDTSANGKQHFIILIKQLYRKIREIPCSKSIHQNEFRHADPHCDGKLLLC